MVVTAVISFFYNESYAACCHSEKSTGYFKGIIRTDSHETENT